MNILVVASGLPPDTLGGGEVFNYNIIQHLKKKHNVSVLTYSKHKIEGVKIYNIKRRVSTKLSYLFWLFNTLYKVKETNNVVFVSHTDNIHWLYFILFPISRKIFNIRYLTILYSGRMIKWKFAFPHRLFFKNASNILALDKMVQEHYMKKTKSEVQLIEQSCDSFINIEPTPKSELRKRYNVPHNSIIVLFFSRFHPIKSPITILEAMEFFDEDYLVRNNLLFWFCGAGEDLDSFKLRVDSKPHMGRFIKIWGRVNEEDKSSIYKMSDIYVQPSLSEGSPPITLEEAMKNGIPSISTRIKQISAHYEENKNILLFKKQNPKDLSDKIKILIENPIKAKELGENAKISYNEVAANDSMLSDIEKYVEESAKT